MDKLNVGLKVSVPHVVSRPPVEARQRLEHFDLPGPEAILIPTLFAKPVREPRLLHIEARVLVTLSNGPAIVLHQETL
jgi:hypothetical protein